jgi:hypothetical protein
MTSFIAIDIEVSPMRRKWLMGKLRVSVLLSNTHYFPTLVSVRLS